MFSKTLLLGVFAALAAAQSSVLTFTNVPNPVTAGQAQAITFATNDTTTPVSIILRQGVSTDLQDVETLTADATNGQYVWTPSSSLPNGNNYALQIKQGEEFNYFGPFSLQGGSSSSSGSSSASASASPIVSANSTTTAVVTPAGTGASASGTGSPISRNTTLSSATLTASSTSSGSSATNTDDAGFQGTGTSSGGSAESTGAASSFQIGSGIALFGAIAAGIFLQ